MPAVGPDLPDFSEPTEVCFTLSGVIETPCHSTSEKSAMWSGPPKAVALTAVTFFVRAVFFYHSAALPLLCKAWRPGGQLAVAFPPPGRS